MDVRCHTKFPIFLADVLGYSKDLPNFKWFLYDTIVWFHIEYFQHHTLCFYLNTSIISSDIRVCNPGYNSRTRHPHLLSRVAFIIHALVPIRDDLALNDLSSRGKEMTTTTSINSDFTACGIHCFHLAHLVSSSCLSVFKQSISACTMAGMGFPA